MTALSAGALLADSDKGRGSPIGLFVILALCVAVYFLWKSLNRHLKKVPESFDPARPQVREATADPDHQARDAADPGDVAPDPAGTPSKTPPAASPAPQPPSEPQS